MWKSKFDIMSKMSKAANWERREVLFSSCSFITSDAQLLKMNMQVKPFLALTPQSQDFQHCGQDGVSEF